MSPRIVTIPFAPDHHAQLEGVGTYTHDQLDALIGGLVTKVLALEAELIQARAATIQRHYIPSMAAGVTEINFPEGFTYLPGAHNLLFYGNFVKQIVGEAYLEEDPTKLTLTDPTVGGETFEFYSFPIPGLGSNIP